MQTIRLEEEARNQEEEEEEEERLEKEKNEKSKVEAASKLTEEMKLQQEEFVLNGLLNDVMKDPAVPRSVACLMKEQTSNFFFVKYLQTFYP